jgi:hypothetical protein
MSIIEHERRHRKELGENGSTSTAPGMTPTNTGSSAKTARALERCRSAITTRAATSSASLRQRVPAVMARAASRATPTTSTPDRRSGTAVRRASPLSAHVLASAAVPETVALRESPKSRLGDAHRARIVVGLPGLVGPEVGGNVARVRDHAAVRVPHLREHRVRTCGLGERPQVTECASLNSRRGIDRLRGLANALVTKPAGDRVDLGLDGVLVTVLSPAAMAAEDRGVARWCWNDRRVWSRPALTLMS